MQSEKEWEKRDGEAENFNIKTLKWKNTFVNTDEMVRQYLARKKIK